MDLTLADGAWEGVEPGVEALLDAWLVAPGDRVDAGQPLARVVLVKASLEVAAPAAGRVRALHVAAGETFARGRSIASLDPAP